MGIIRLGCDDYAAPYCLGHVVAQGLGDRIKGQRAIHESSDKFQAVHLSLSIRADGPIRFADGAALFS